MHLADAFNDFNDSFTLKLTFDITGVLEPAYCLPFIPLLSRIHTEHTACPKCPISFHRSPDTPERDLHSTECPLLVLLL